MYKEQKSWDRRHIEEALRADDDDERHYSSCQPEHSLFPN